MFNGGKFLYETITSIINQSYYNLEIIIIDGGSIDNTIEIIKSFDSPLIKWISETDNGISDAFNKGIKLATGDYINFQGDGDGFINNSSISDLFSNLDLMLNMTFSKFTCFLYTDLKYVICGLPIKYKSFISILLFILYL